MTLENRPRGKLNARAVYRWEADEIAIALWTTDFQNGHRLQIGRPVLFEDTSGPIKEPALELTGDAARALMDSLWEAGVRPTQQGSPGELGAVKKHLADMRAISFAKLELKAPE